MTIDKHDHLKRIYRKRWLSVYETADGVRTARPADIVSKAGHEGAGEREAGVREGEDTRADQEQSR